MIVVVAGVSGAGKTTVARALAAELHWRFLEGDELHPRSNIEAMASGRPLADEDRWPWLEAIAARMDAWVAERIDGVVACSALRRTYRDYLAAAGRDVRFVALDLPLPVAADRAHARPNHFMPPALLESQYATWERPGQAEGARTVVLDATRPVPEIVAEVRSWIGESERPGRA